MGILLMEKKKYILEVEEDPTTIRLVKLKNGENGLPCMQFVAVSPYKYDEAYQMGVHDTATEIEAIKDEAYKRGREDAIDAISSKEQSIADKACQSVWEVARKIILPSKRGGFTIDEFAECFGSDVSKYDVVEHYSASEAIEKIKAYEQKQEQQIQVWDEVKVFERKPFIVTGFGYGDDDVVYCHGFVTENGISISAKKDECVKTGRSFPEIAEVMRKMKEG